MKLCDIIVHILFTVLLIEYHKVMASNIKCCHCMVKNRDLLTIVAFANNNMNRKYVTEEHVGLMTAVYGLELIRSDMSISLELLEK